MENTLASVYIAANCEFNPIDLRELWCLCTPFSLTDEDQTVQVYTCESATSLHQRGLFEDLRWNLGSCDNNMGRFKVPCSENPSAYTKHNLHDRELMAITANPSWIHSDIRI